MKALITILSVTFDFGSSTAVANVQENFDELIGSDHPGRNVGVPFENVAKWGDAEVIAAVQAAYPDADVLKPDELHEIVVDKLVKSGKRIRRDDGAIVTPEENERIEDEIERKRDEAERARAEAEERADAEG